MNTELETFIQTSPLIDTHEHLRYEQVYVEAGPDILQDLFENYVLSDLRSAGATQEAVNELINSKNSDIHARFEGVREAWLNSQFTGYGEAVRIIAEKVYGMSEITGDTLEAAQEKNRALRQPGERLRILKDVANLDHVQIDDGIWECKPDESGADFFLYDLSWVGFSCGEILPETIYNEVQIDVTNLETLREAMHALFAKYSPCAIAVKTQHAYNRTLDWQERPDRDAAIILQKTFNNADLSTEEQLILGDWCLARGVELAIEHNLPFKIHTGYYAGNNNMPSEYIHPGNLCRLLAKYPQAKFVLMHIGYPYQEEMISLAKHYTNVWVDLCWAWSINPLRSMEFVRGYIHAAPINKLFGFGGDTGWANSSYAYSLQMRNWFNRALQAEVNDGYLTEAQAIGIAEKIMLTNQQACFDIEGTRQAIREAMGKA